MVQANWLCSTATTGRTDAALVRFVTAIDAGGVEAADARMQNLIADVLPQLTRFVSP